MSEQSDHNSLLQSRKGSEDSEVPPQCSNQGGASSTKDCTDGSSLDYLKLIEHSPAKDPGQDKLISASQAPGVAPPPFQEHSKTHIKGQSAHLLGPEHTEDGHSKRAKRALTDEDTQHSQSKRPRTVIHQPQPLARATVSRREQFLHYCRASGLSNGTYKREQYTERNQNVLGLKYIHDRHGNPRRPILYANRPPDYIDKVVGYHNNSRAAKGPPPGLETQRGQFTSSDMSAGSMFAQSQHDRLRYCTVKQASEGTVDVVDTVVQCESG
jgi:hypothetical protein